VRYAAVLAPASKLRPRLVPEPPQAPAHDASAPPKTGSRYRPWAELLKRGFGLDEGLDYASRYS
jgi:hypothetical protein